MNLTVGRLPRPEGWRYLAASAAGLVPCFWQSRLQAGDLSSHIYNAWLARLIESGQTSGLAVAHQSTNVLFDLLLSGLYRTMGTGPAQRTAVSLAVLIFLWGAFAFVAAVSGRKPWGLLPCLLMLTYGWVFHEGLFNFYLSLGLCFWALALVWPKAGPPVGPPVSKDRPRRWAAAAAILAVAYLAHALPVAWSAGLAVWLLGARRLTPGRRAALTAGCVLALAGLHAALAFSMYTRWSPVQITFATGLDQFWVYDPKYFFVLMGMAGIWLLLLIGLVRTQGLRTVVSSLPFQLCLLTAAAIAVLPGTAFLPGFRHALSSIAERMSLGAAICSLAVLASVRLRGPERAALWAAAAAYFAFLYADERTLNRFEDRMEHAVSALAPGQRVISGIGDWHLRVNAITHTIDRVCVERCYSYANYEPSTGQFRVRALGPNPLVASTYAESWRLQTGAYLVKTSDLPLYEVDIDKQGRMLVRKLDAGAQSGSTNWQTLPDWLGLG